MDISGALAKHGKGLLAMRDQVKKDPAHEKVYGPALDAMMANHAELTKAATPVGGDKTPEEEAEAAKAAGAQGAGAGAGATDSAGDDGVEEKKEMEKKEAARAAANADFEKMSENYKAGKMTETEKVIFEALLKEKKETAIRENVAMVARHIKESGLPETYSDDLAIICAGKPEADVKKLVEARKNLVAPLLGNRATGAGAGSGGKNEPSKLTEKLKTLGVKTVVKS